MNHFVLFYIVSLVVITHEFEIDTSEGNGPCGDYPTKPDFDASKVSSKKNYVSYIK